MTGDPRGWPRTRRDLEAAQRTLARIADDVEPWEPPAGALPAVGGTFAAGASMASAERERLWASAVSFVRGGVVGTAVVREQSGPPYAPGLLALRQGPLLERAVRALGVPVDILVVNATGRDHPRRAGLALHLGAVLGIPTVGVTDRPLVAEVRTAPGADRGSAVPLVVADEIVAMLARTAVGARPVVVHAGWRTNASVALSLVLEVTGRSRTPEPIRRARRLVRIARARDEGRLGPEPG